MREQRGRNRRIEKVEARRRLRREAMGPKERREE